MRTRQGHVAVGAVALLTLLPLGCTRPEATVAPSPSPDAAAAKPTEAEVEKALKEASERDRQKFASMTFEEWKASVYKEPFDGGKYIVNGDTPVLGDKQLQEFFETRVKQAPPPPPSIQRQVELAVGHVGGLDLAWNQQMQGQLEYCVSKPGFGARYDAVVRDMAAATEAWEGVAAVDFKHDVGQDGACGPTNRVGRVRRAPGERRRAVPRARVLPERAPRRAQRPDRRELVRARAGRQAAARRHPATRARAHDRLPPRAHAAERGAVLRGQRLAAAHGVRPALGHALPPVQRPGRLEPDPHSARPERLGVPLRRGRGVHDRPEPRDRDLVPHPRPGSAHRESRSGRSSAGSPWRSAPRRSTGPSPSSRAPSSRRR